MKRTLTSTTLAPYDHIHDDDALAASCSTALVPFAKVRPKRASGLGSDEVLALGRGKDRSRSMNGNVCGGRSVLRTKNGHDVLGFVVSVVAVYTVEREEIVAVGVLWWMRRRGR